MYSGTLLKAFECSEMTIARINNFRLICEADNTMHPSFKLVRRYIKNTRDY